MSEKGNSASASAESTAAAQAAAASYPLEIESIGEDIYIVISRGHHDIHAFMRKVREEGYEWPLGVPEHIWMKTVPARKGSGFNAWYYPVKAGTRGAWPCTYVTEGYGKDSYEARLPDLLASSAAAVAAR